MLDGFTGAHDSAGGERVNMTMGPRHVSALILLQPALEVLEAIAQNPTRRLDMAELERLADMDRRSLARGS